MAILEAPQQMIVRSYYVLEKISKSMLYGDLCPTEPNSIY